MGPTRSVAAAAFLSALLALAGCGGDGDGDGESGGSSGDGAGSSSSESYPTQTKSACEVLTVEVARQLLGSVSRAASPAPEAGSDDVTVSTCTRTNRATSVTEARTASLLMRVAETGTGAKSNEAVFASSSLPKGAEEVEGYGEKAFWNPAFGQLNILEGGNWYILSVGPIDPKKHTLDETEKFADAIIDDL
jgi:hypothetical protein